MLQLISLFSMDVITHFWVPAQKGKKLKRKEKNNKKNKIQKKNIIKKIYDNEKGCQNAQKMIKNLLRMFKNTKIKI